MDRMSRKSDIISELFLLHSNSIYRYAKYCLPRDIDSKDVVQEVFLRAFRSWDEFQGNSDPKTWLFSIARNHIYDLLRKKKRERMHEIFQSTRPQEGSENLNTIIELEDALSRLHPNYRQILVLRLIQDLSIPDIAKVLDWSESKVRITFHRARKKLQAELQDQPVFFFESERSDTTHGKQSN